MFKTSRVLIMDTEFMKEDYNQCADINRIMNVINMGLEKYRPIIKYVYLAPSSMLHMKLSRIDEAQIYVVYYAERFEEEGYELALEQADNFLKLATDGEFGTTKLKIDFVPEITELDSKILIYSGEFPTFDVPPLTQQEIDLFYELLCSEKEYKIFLPYTWGELENKTFILKYKDEILETLNNIMDIAKTVKVDVLSALSTERGISCCPVYLYNKLSFRLPYIEINLRKLDKAQMELNMKNSKDSGHI